MTGNDWVIYGALAAAGIAAGFINTIAGAGGLVTLPTLLWTGLAAPVANATMRVGIVWACAVGARGLWRQGLRPQRAWIAPLLLTTSAGGAGALVAGLLAAKLLYGLLLVGCAVAALSLLLPQSRAGREVASGGALGTVVMTAAGFYGGLIQTGVGLLLLAAGERFVSRDLRLANVFKLWSTGLFNVVALLVFIVMGLVRWDLAVPLAVGSVLGAEIAVRVATRIPQRPLRWGVGTLALVVVVVLMIRGPGA